MGRLHKGIHDSGADGLQGGADVQAARYVEQKRFVFMSACSVCEMSDLPMTVAAMQRDENMHLEHYYD